MTLPPGIPLPAERRGSNRATDRTTNDLVGAVVRLLPDAALVVDDDGRIVGANSLADALFGYPSGTLLGKSVEELVPERLRSGHTGHRANYATHPTQRPMGAGLELWAKRRDGSEFPVDISLAPLGVPERPLTLAAVRDLTERRAEWADLARLAAIVSASDDAIISTDLNGAITSWNPGAEHLLGYRAEEIVGSPISRLVAANRIGEIDQEMAQVRTGKRVPASDTRLVHSNGTEVDVSESVSLIREPTGDPIGFAWLVRDATERKLAETELRRLLRETQRRERWLEAISDIRLELLAGGELGDWLELIARRVCELVGCGSSAVVLRGERGNSVVVAASVGSAFAQASSREVRTDDSIVRSVLAVGKTWAVEDLGRAVEEFGLAPSSRADGPDAGTGTAGEGLLAAGAPGELAGPFALAPLITSQGVGGVLAVARACGEDAFGHEDIRMVESLAQQAGLAVEIARAQADREELTLIADRERIARDLHDHVIQRLFAVGMALQAAAHSIEDSKSLERINDSVEELDATIRDVRSTIFSLDLRAHERVETSARSQVLDVVSKAAAGLGFQPRLQFDGPVDTRLPDEMIPDVLAVVRESLSNVARHARASTAEVKIQVRDDLVLTITDDGQGMRGVTRLSGLANMRARAESRGGSMSARSEDGKGTRIEWRVPLPT